MNSKMKQNLVLVADNDKLIKFRKEKDKHWKEDEQSPLTEEQKKTFKRLNYFLPNPDLRFELPLLTDIPDLGKQVVIKTTGGDEQVYKRAGKIRFKVDGKEIETIVFEDPKVDYFQNNLLFKDKTTVKKLMKTAECCKSRRKGIN